MPRSALCASCSTPIQLGGRSLPAGQATCRACRKVTRKPFDPSKCGTPLGRGQHRRRGEQPCEPCRLAWNEVTRERLAKLRASGWVRPDRPARLGPVARMGKGACGKCGKEIRTASDDPMCAECRRLDPGRTIPISRADRLAIYERDGWTCGICLESVDPAAQPNTTWDATLDHIVPRSKGGTHATENLRLAHRWCNSARNDESYYTDADFQVA